MEHQLAFCQHCKTLIYYWNENAGWYHTETDAVWCHWQGPNKHKNKKAEPEKRSKQRKEK